MTGGFLTLGIAALVLLLGGLLVYMSQLIKNAYQIKIELQSEVESGLRRVEDEADRKAKWLKRDTFEELEKIKAAMAADLDRRTSQLQEALNKRLQERDELWKRDRMELIKVLEQQRETIRQLDQRMRALKREQRRIDLLPLAEGTGGVPEVKEEAEVVGPEDAGGISPPP